MESDQTASPKFIIYLAFFASLTLLCWHISSSTIYKNCPFADVPPKTGGDFNVSNVREHLKTMTNFGVKNTGSYANENLTANYITKIIKNIIKSPHNNKEITFDVQKVSGSFNFGFIEKFISVYENMQNIIVRVKSKQKSSNQCLLINCHFDSAVDSPGSSDDIVSCANMLEVLRIVSLEKTKAEKCLIFLFNGAEENILQASHGFTTRHSWLGDIKGFVNLEACGSGGNQILFQSTPGSDWLLSLYRNNAPYPFGSVIGQDIFGSGLIPSDTDYRIFKNIGNISGLDFAFSVNGYVYHTPDDSDRFIDDCTIHKAGNNLLAISKAFLEEPDPIDYSSDKKMVYLNIFSSSFIFFPISWANLLCYSVFLLSLLSVYYKIFAVHYILRSKYIFIYISAFLLIASTFISSIGINMILSGVFHFVRMRMTWFSNYLNLVIYCVPPLVVVLASHHYFGLMWEFGNEGVLAGLVLQSFGFFNVFVSFLLLWHQKGSLVYSLINAFFINLYCWIDSPQNLYVSLIIYFGVLFIPIFLTLSSIHIILVTLIPIMGRSGNVIPSDTVISILIAFVVVYTLTFMVQLFYAKFNCKKLILWILIFYVVYVLVLYFTPLGFPFSAKESQPRKRRLFFINACRSYSLKSGEIYKEDCGIYMIAGDSYNDNEIYLDPGTPTNHRIVLNGSEAYYGFPFFLPIRSLFGNVYKADGWDDHSSSGLNKTFRVLSKLLLSKNTTRVSVEIDVTSNCNFAVLPINGRATRVELVSLNEVYHPNSTSNVFILYVRGLAKDLFLLTFDIESDYDVDESSTVGKFSVSWNLLSHDKHLVSTGEDNLDKFVKIFPKCVSPTVLRSKYQSIDL